MTKAWWLAVLFSLFSLFSGLILFVHALYNLCLFSPSSSCSFVSSLLRFFLEMKERRWRWCWFSLVVLILGPSSSFLAFLLLPPVFIFSGLCFRFHSLSVSPVFLGLSLSLSVCPPAFFVCALFSSHYLVCLSVSGLLETVKTMVILILISVFSACVFLVFLSSFPWFLFLFTSSPLFFLFHLSLSPLSRSVFLLVRLLVLWCSSPCVLCFFCFGSWSAPCFSRSSPHCEAFLWLL